MITINVPRKEFTWDLLYALEDVFKKMDLRGCMTITETMPVPIQQITVEGALVVEGLGDAQKTL